MLDLERLAVPSWVCVHFASAEDLHAEALSALDAGGIAQFHLAAEAARGDAELLRALADAMAFPAYFGMNWDAAEECLRDLGDWRPANGYVLFVHDADWLWRHAYESMGPLTEIWQAVAEEWAQDDIAFHLVFVARPAAISTA
jgi:hypothetical protein